MSNVNHYQYIEKHGDEFSEKLGLPYSIKFDLSANGDKASGFDHVYEEMNIPKVQGRLVFMLGYFKPYVDERDEIGTLAWLRKALTDTTILNVLTELGVNDA